MTKFYGTNTTPRGATPVGQIDGSYSGGRVRLYEEKITLATQTTSDTIVIAYPSAGETFLFGLLVTDTSLSTSTIAIGITGNTGKYRAAAVFTATLNPTLFGAVVTDLTAFTKLTAAEEVFITIAVASLPASGTLITKMFFAAT